MIRLIATDVGGTLLGSAGVVSLAVQQSAERARAAGIRLVLCTGRPAFGATLQYARQLDEHGWHVFQNGASVLDLRSGQTQSIELPHQALRELVSHARRRGEILELYSDRDYVTENSSGWARANAASLGVPFEVRSFESLRGPAIRAQWLVPRSRAESLLGLADASLEIAVSVSPLMPDTAFVGMTRSGADKGNALRTVAAAYEIDLCDVMYVGDADNDLSALRIAGHPVAMANGTPLVKALASTVVGHVDESGLAQAIDLAIDSLQAGN